MNKFFSIIGVAALLATVAYGQTTTPPPSTTQSTVQEVQGIGSTVGGWFTSENPANRYQDVLTWAGVVNQNNAPIANEVGASYDLWRQHADYFPYTAATNQSESTIYAAIEARERSSTPGVLSIGAGPQIGWMQNDIRLGFFVEPVYRLDKKHSKFRAEAGFMGDKMLTKNTAIGLQISWQTHEAVPFIGANMNVSFGNGSGLFGLFNKSAPAPN